MTEPLHKRGETYFLNLRFLLIITVFISNAIEPLIGKMDSMHTLYVWIFTFHMPLFVLVTGYFAKTSLKGTAGRNVILQIAMQYIIFQSLYSMLDHTVFHVQNIHRSFFAPYLLLWFLASHICWRLLTLAIHKFTCTQQIALSLILGVLVGYLQLDGVWLSISRTFVYLPFFLIGYHFSYEKFVIYFTKQKKIAAAMLSITLLLLIGFLGFGIPQGWLLGSMTYMQLGQPYWYVGGAMRLAIYALQMVSATAFLAFVPEIQCQITELGKRTLYVFLLHGFIIRFAAVSGIYNYVHNAGGAFLVIALACLVTVFLAQPLVRHWAHPIVEPKVNWIIRLERLTIGRPL